MITTMNSVFACTRSLASKPNTRLRRILPHVGTLQAYGYEGRCFTLYVDLLQIQKGFSWKKPFYQLWSREKHHGTLECDNRIECFHMTSRRPYWCPKTMKRKPCWCPKPVLWELNSFLMQTLSFVPINLHRCWPREWKHSITRLEILGID